MKRALLGGLLALATMSAPAMATTAFVDHAMTIHAGPGENFPVLERVSPDTRLWIYGCRANGDWCDVSHGRLRGWIATNGLLLRRGAGDDIPTASFDLERYWSQNYPREAFYADRATWAADSAGQVAAEPTTP